VVVVVYGKNRGTQKYIQDFHSKIWREQNTWKIHWEMEK
jgi:hypothetical protein